MKIIRLDIIDPSGTIHVLDGIEGWRAMEVIRDSGLPIKAECGGACACATCHVYVADAWLDHLPPMSDEERDRLDEAFEVEPNSRLSCQIILNESLDGLALALAPGSEP